LRAKLAYDSGLATVVLRKLIASVAEATQQNRTGWREERGLVGLLVYGRRSRRVGDTIACEWHPIARKTGAPLGGFWIACGSAGIGGPGLCSFRE
jgi:hypothetical protein